MSTAPRLLLLGLACATIACRGGVPGAGAKPAGPPCPAEAPAPPVLPFAHPLHNLPEFWLARSESPEQLLADRVAIEEQNRAVQALGERGWPAGRWQVTDARLAAGRVKERLRERLEKLAIGVRSSTRVLASGEPARSLLAELRAELERIQPVDEARIAHRSTPLRCFPTETAVYEKAWDLPFDLMQCAQLRLGEPVRVLARLGDRFLYVWSSYADGWVRPSALTPPIAPAQLRAFLEPARFALAQLDRVPLHRTPSGEAGGLLGAASFGLALPLLEAHAGDLPPFKVAAPTPAGLGEAWIRRPGAITLAPPPLTRRNLLEAAFRLLNTPYGWGGTGDGRDCSRLMMDLFASFGVLLPRNTWHQSQAGNHRIAVAALPEAAKAEAIDRAAGNAAVLLFMPGHIMLYLGRDGDHLYALHLFSGYLTPCPGGGETMQRVNRTVVTALDLGLHGSRRSFLQRITRLVLIGSPPR
jgi:hypothetical protein